MEMKLQRRTNAIPDRVENTVRKCPKCSSLLSVYKQDNRMYICHNCAEIFPIYSAPASLVIAPPSYHKEDKTKERPIVSASNRYQKKESTEEKYRQEMADKISKLGPGITVNKRNVNIRL